MRRVGIDLDLAGLAGRLAGSGHLLDRLDRDALVGSAIQPKHRRLQIAGEVDGIFRL